MKGKPCNTHPASRVGKRNSACGRPDAAVEVEDHGVGFMFVGTSDIDQAKYLIEDYVDDPHNYVFAARFWYENRACAVWLVDTPGAMPYGATGISSPVREALLG